MFAKLEYHFCDIVFKITSLLCKNLILTCIRSDGGGAQLHARLYLITFAEEYKFSFYNTEMRNVPHSYGANVIFSSENDFGWNSLFIFENKSEIPSDVKVVRTKDSKHLCVRFIKIILSGNFNKPHLFEVESIHRFANQSVRIRNQMRHNARQLFSPVPYSGDEKVIIHLRRGDAVEGDPHWESDSEFLVKIKSLTDKYPGEKIRIFTNDEFKIPKELNTIVILDNQSSPFSMISHVADSQVFAMAKSSMSYVAALLTAKTVYCPEFWCAPLSTWKKYSELN